MDQTTLAPAADPATPMTLVDDAPQTTVAEVKKPEPQLPATTGKPPETTTQRLLSLDVYRGLIMVTLAFNGFGLLATATNHLKNEPYARVWEPVRDLRDDNDVFFWKVIGYQFNHVEWVGCAYWDLIQPSFMFMVGVAMAYSYLKRKQQGQSYGRMLGHAMWRSVVLIVLGIFLISNFGTSTEWSFMNVLTQIGLGYTFLFLLWGRSPGCQAAFAVGILVATFLAYHFYPTEGISLKTGSPRVGVSQEFAARYLSDVPPAWHKNANAGHDLDLWVLNALPTTFHFNRGGYQTLNFLPSLATMIFGLMCGELLRSQRSNRYKLLWLAAGGVAGLSLGLVLHHTDICPIVKRIWTPSWVLFSTGWCCVILLFLYGVVDVLGWRRWWTFPLIVVGMNSIAIYCMSMLLKGWASRTYKIHFGQNVFYNVSHSIVSLVTPDLSELDQGQLAKLYLPTVEATMVGLVFFAICLWMYRQKIFIRI